MSRRLHTLFFLLILPCLASARSDVSRRARKAYESALRQEAKGHWSRAEHHLQKAIREERSFTDAYVNYGMQLIIRHQYAAAAAILGDGEKLCGNGQKVFARPLAQSLLCSGNIAEALKRMPPNPADTFWRRLSAQASFMQEAVAHADTGIVTPVGPLWGINTADAELFPMLSADGRKLYFTRRMGGVDEDFFYAVPDTCGGWQSARNMGAAVNTLQQEAALALSSDGHYRFFMRCDNRSLSGWDQGGCDLLMAYAATDSAWSTALPFGGTINTPGFEGMPSLSSDNRELYFVSNRPGGYGGLDIWSSRFEHGLWQVPRNLGPAINSAGDESAPYICADGTTLYFASNGRGGMGGSDLFISRKTDDTTWTTAENLGMPLKTPFEEASLSLNRAGDTALFASDRDSLAGNFDLYQYPLPPRFRPQPVYYLKGRLYDSLSRAALNYGNIYITDSASGKELYQVQSNRGDGSYDIALPLGRAYFLYTDRIGYSSRGDTLRGGEAGVTYPLDLALLPSDYVAPTKDSLVCTIFFQKNRTELTDSDRLAIQVRLAPWRDLAVSQVLVNGYTDNSGTPLLNEQLSYQRAKVVADAVLANGFLENAVRSQGWGEAAPIVENDTDEHRDKNRRVEIIIRK